MSLPTGTRPFTLGDFLDLSGLLAPNTTAAISANTSSFCDPTTNYTPYVERTDNYRFDSHWTSNGNLSHPSFSDPSIPFSPNLSVNRMPSTQPNQLPAYTASTMHHVQRSPHRSDSMRTQNIPPSEVRTRYQLRRSNTVAASNVGERGTNLRDAVPLRVIHKNPPSQPSPEATSYRRASEAPRPSPSQSDGMSAGELIRRLLNQPSRRAGPTSSIGPSPTERVMRKLGTLLPSNMERNPTGSYALTSVTTQGYAVAGMGKVPSNVEGIEIAKVTIGGFQPGSLTSPIQRRCRLRREHTIDVGGPLPTEQSRSESFSKYLSNSNRAITESQSSEPNNLSFDLQKTRLSSQLSIDDREFDSDIPDELQFTAERFQGRTLVQWLCRQLVRTGMAWSYNLITLVAHICTCLVRLGVLQLDPTGTDTYINASSGLSFSLPNENNLAGSNNDVTDKFDLNRYYKWSGSRAAQLADLSEHSSTNRPFDLSGNSMRSSQECLPFQPRLQGELVELRREYEYELDRLSREHELQLFKVKNQGVMKVCQLTDRIEVLEQEVEKYRILAGIERLTKSPMLEENKRGRGFGSNAYRYSDASEDDSRHSSAEGRRPRVQRVGFSVTETHDTSPPQTRTALRPRASSEVSYNSVSHSKLQEDGAPIDRLQNTSIQEPASVDELHKTKGFLRKFKEYNSGTTDSGISGSKGSRSDSRDTTQRSVISDESIEQKELEEKPLHRGGFGLRLTKQATLSSIDSSSFDSADICSEGRRNSHLTATQIDSFEPDRRMNSRAHVDVYRAQSITAKPHERLQTGVTMSKDREYRGKPLPPYIATNYNDTHKAPSEVRVKDTSLSTWNQSTIRSRSSEQNWSHTRLEPSN